MKKSIAEILYYLLKLLVGDIQQYLRDKAEIKKAGDKAEAAADAAVSELQTPEGEDEPNLEVVPSVKKWSDFFKHRRNRTRP